MSKFTTCIVAIIFSLGAPSIVSAGSIFSGTPFEEVANAVGNATGTNNLQQKLGLPNAGGAVADFFEAAKKNSGPLVTSIVTLNCPGCVLAAGVVSGPGAAMEAVFTTGLVTSAFETSPLLGIATVVILASDRQTGQSGYQQVMVPVANVPATQKTYQIAADCIIKDKAHNTIFAVFKNAPANASDIKDGDILNLTAPDCKAFSDPANESMTAVKVKRSGAQAIGMAQGRFTYVMVGSST